MTIVASTFARVCVQRGLFFAVQPHYLAAVARLRSHIVDDTQGDLIGPFRLTRADWGANNVDTDFQVNYLPTDITNWVMQCSVFALMTHRTLERLAADNKSPSAVDLYMAQWPATDATTIAAELQTALDDTASLIEAAAKEVFDDPASPGGTIGDATNPGLSPPSTTADKLDLASIAPNRRPYASMILDAFAGAGYGKWQQIAALANAIGESALKPDAALVTAQEASYGLFQVNTRPSALGANMTAAQLKDPATNISVVLNEIRRFPVFKLAQTLETSVALFVQKLERPKYPQIDTEKRILIARRLLQ